MQLTFEVPDKYFMFQSSAEVVQMLKLNTAVDLYKNGRMSSGAAAEFVGEMNKYEFLYECRKHGVEPQTYESIDEVLEEVDTFKNSNKPS